MEKRFFELNSLFVGMVKNMKSPMLAMIITLFCNSLAYAQENRNLITEIDRALDLTNGHKRVHELLLNAKVIPDSGLITALANRFLKIPMSYDYGYAKKHLGKEWWNLPSYRKNEYGLNDRYYDVKAYEQEELVKLVKYLLDQGILSPNSQSNYKITPLMLFAVSDFPYFAEDFMNHYDFDPNFQNDKGWTLAMLTAELGNEKIGLKIIDHPHFNPNLQNANGLSAIMLALENGKPEMAMKILGHKDFDANIRDKEGWTAAMYAINYGFPAVAKALAKLENFNPNVIENKDLATAVFFAARNGLWDVVEAMALTKNFNPNIIDKYDWTLAKLASGKGELKTLELLKKLGADFNLPNPKNSVIQAAKDSGNYKKLFKFIDPKAYMNHLGQVLEQFREKLGLPNYTYACDEEDIASHLHFIFDPNSQEAEDEKNLFKDKDLSCSTCYTPFDQEGQAFFSQGNCDCLYCPTCAFKFKRTFLQEKEGKLPSCSIHQKIAPYSFLRAVKASNDELYNYKLLSMMNELNKIENFRLCMTPNCPTGMLLSPGEIKWYSCELCGKESLLSFDGSKDPMPDPRSPIRPCPFCLKLYTKDDGCNHVTCANPSCGNKFNFEYGKSDPPAGTDWNLYSDGPRLYRVKGDVNQKTGEVYLDYREGVTPGMDLK